MSTQGGFWRPGPYVELGRDYTYPEARAHLKQTVIAEPDGSVDVYRVWNKVYTRPEIVQLLEDAGFAVEGVWESLSGSELRDDSPTLAVIARKK